MLKCMDKPFAFFGRGHGSQASRLSLSLSLNLVRRLFFWLYSTGFLVRGVVVFSFFPTVFFGPRGHGTKVHLVVWFGLVWCGVVVVSCLYPTETAFHHSVIPSFRHSVILSPFGNTWLSSCVGLVLVGWGALSVLPCSGISCYVWYRAIYPIEYQRVGRNQVRTCPPPLAAPPPILLSSSVGSSLDNLDIISTALLFQLPAMPSSHPTL